MNCHQARLEISNSPKEAREIGEVALHLRRCAACRNFAEEEEALEAWLEAQAVEMDPSPRLWLAIEGSIAEGAQGWWPHLEALFFPSRLQYAALSLVALLAFSVGLLLTATPESPSAELLAELQTYELPVRQNPFLPAWGGDGNPFFRWESSGNPFRSTK